MNKLINTVKTFGENEGLHIYFVGGGVRDFLLERQDPVDLDFVLKGDIQKLLTLLKENLGGTLVTMDRHEPLYRLVLEEGVSLDLRK